MLLTCKIEEKTDGKQNSTGPTVKEKTYTYTQLKDLQSKLTLVAGEQQEKNKETIQTFDNVRLYHRYLSPVSIKCFSDRNQSELFARANTVAFCRFP